MSEQPVVVCLCGSTRFYQTFQKVNLEETLAGRIVLSIGNYGATDVELGIKPDSEQKAMLEELHLRKIDMCDEVLILNVDGYIGPSTWGELVYAVGQAKRVRFLDRKAGAELMHKVFEAFGGDSATLCGAVYDHAPDGDSASWADLPCVLAPGHALPHYDKNGDDWTKSKAECDNEGAAKA